MDGTRKGPAVDRERLLHVGSKTLGEMRGHRRHCPTQALPELRADSGGELAADLGGDIVKRLFDVRGEVALDISPDDLLEPVRDGLARDGRNPLQQGGAALGRIAFGIRDELPDEIPTEIRGARIETLTGSREPLSA